MKIGNNIESLQSELLARAANGSRSPSVPQAQQVGAVSGVDKVELSEVSQRLTGDASGSRETEIRADKVEQVRLAIAQGQFKVSAHVVAEKMIADAAELIEVIARRSQGE